jgi:hypothetical protein
MMKELKIDRSEWREFVESFTRQHRNWLTTIKVLDDRGKSRIIAAERPLEDVTLNGDTEIEVRVLADHESARTIEYKVQNPERLEFEESDEGAHKGLRIESAGGIVTLIEFRVAARPEALDGKI